MNVATEGRGDAAFFYADLYRDGTKVCRIALTGGSMSEEAARRLLVMKARMWIDDYLTRPHTGRTEYGTLS